MIVDCDVFFFCSTLFSILPFKIAGTIEAKLQVSTVASFADINRVETTAHDYS